jgi:hypothetical protein
MYRDGNNLEVRQKLEHAEGPKVLTSRRCRNIGNKAKSWTENNTREKTAISSGRREASTTDEAMPAFIDRTDVRL